MKSLISMLIKYSQNFKRVTAMSLEFGLTMTGLGVLAMFSALAVIIIACEVLKRRFKEAEVEITPAEALVEETLMEREGISEEEEAAITAAVIAYISEMHACPTYA